MLIVDCICREIIQESVECRLNCYVRLTETVSKKRSKSSLQIKTNINKSNSTARAVLWIEEIVFVTSALIASFHCKWSNISW